MLQESHDIILCGRDLCSNYVLANSEVNQGWLFGLCWYFSFGIKLSMPEEIHSEMSETILVALILKKAERKSFAK